MVKLVRENISEKEWEGNPNLSYYERKYHARQDVHKGEREENIAKIKEFAEKNNFEFGLNKNGTPFVSIPISYKMIKSYDKLQWPTMVTSVNYTFTYTQWDTPISLRKVWYGYESNPSDYWDGPWNKAFAKRGICTDKDREEYYEMKFKKLEKDMKAAPEKFKIKNLKQALMGRFDSLDKAFKRILSSSQKELKKKDI